MSEIGAIKPKRVAVIVKEDGSTEVIEAAPAELQGLSMPKKPAAGEQGPGKPGENKD